MCFPIGLGYFTSSNRTIFLCRINFERLLKRHEMYFSWAVLSSSEKRTALCLFKSGHLFEHDLLLLSAAVLMRTFNLLINVSIFIIFWFSYWKCLFCWKLNFPAHGMDWGKLYSVLMKGDVKTINLEKG